MHNIFCNPECGSANMLVCSGFLPTTLTFTVNFIGSEDWRARLDQWPQMTKFERNFFAKSSEYQVWYSFFILWLLEIKNFPSDLGSVGTFCCLVIFSQCKSLTASKVQRKKRWWGQYSFEYKSFVFSVSQVEWLKKLHVTGSCENGTNKR